MHYELYLDYASTAPVREAVKQRVVELLDVFGNPSSLHGIGMTAETVLQDGRKQILHALKGNGQGSLIFTGGGTEANNLAVLGSAKQLSKRGKHIITTSIEHPAVLEPMRQLEQAGWDVTYVLPDETGDICLSSILDAIRSDTVLVSVMHVNNETGAILPIAELGKALQAYPKIHFHVDGTQAFGKMPVDVRRLNVDLYTISAHKIGGLKGVGALYMKSGIRTVPVVFGGGQEFGVRSGTENVIGCAAFATAASEAVQQLGSTANASELRTWFVKQLQAIEGWHVNNPKHASPYIVNATLKGTRGEVVVHALERKSLYVSAGSACSTAKGQKKRSHVLAAMGMSDADSDASVRFSWHPETDKETLERALQVITEETAWLQSMLGL